MALPLDEQQKIINRTLGPQYRVLPHRRLWSGLPRTAYVDNMPDILEGGLRQFATKMLDIGRLGITEPDRYAVYRSTVFDTRDALINELREWLEFLGMTDYMGRIDATVRDTLLDV